MPSIEELEQVIRSVEHWKLDPLPKMLNRASTNNGVGLSEDQYSALHCSNMVVLMEGGNQSGKSRTSVLKTVAFALEQIDGSFPGQDVNIWYCTTTYDKFAEQAWRHFKDALLWPLESTAKLPTTRIEAINWLGKSPEKPGYFAIKRPSGKLAHVYVHTYAQGRSEFQGQTIHYAVVDEECSEEIFTEIWARTLASTGAKLCIACTPIEGEEWLDRLRRSAEQESQKTKLYRFKTIDNPSVNREAVEEMKRIYKDVPEELELRLLGIPRLGSALVYSDRIFTGDHLVDFTDLRFDSNNWAYHRCIDAGFRHPACVWVAVRRDEKQIVVYRSWKGKDLTIAEAARQILKLSEGETYYWDLIDPATLQRSPETGQPELIIWHANGIRANPAPDNKVRSGIERVWALMSERIEVANPDGSSRSIPRFRVCRDTCVEWLDERRKYRIRDIIKEPERDAVDFRPVKQNDHVMDPTRYLVSAGLCFAEPGFHLPPPGSPARMWHDMRHKKPNKRRK